MSYRPWQPTPHWERRIVETLRRTPAFFLTDLGTATDAAALDRAAHELELSGKIRVEQAAGFGVIIYRVGNGRPDPLRIARLKAPGP
jgi:hypothetical protein